MQIKINKEKIISFLKELIKNPLFYVLIALFVFDIMTKWIMVNYFKAVQGDKVILIPNVLYVTLSFNKGGIFGMGNGALWSRVLLIIVRLLLAILIPVIYLLKGRDIKLRYKVCLTMIYAGCIGNLVDGLFYWKNITGFDGVVDWIGMPFFLPEPRFSNYIYNLADSYITVAVVLLIIFIIIDEVKEVKERNRKGAYTLTPEEYEKKLKEENIKKNGYTNKK